MTKAVLEPVALPAAGKSRFAWRRIRREPITNIFILFVVLQAICIIGALALPTDFRYLTPTNIGLLFRAIPMLGIISLGVGMLMITGDDYGYWPSYNEGILEAVEMGGLDCVSVMVDREYCEPEPLLETGVEIGLHIEFEGRWGPRSGAPARTALRVQLERFGDLVIEVGRCERHAVRALFTAREV